MSDINSVSPAVPTALPTRATLAPASSPVNGVSRGRDQADFSTAATLLSRLNSLPTVRQDVVDRVRGEIEAGTYETPEKLDEALNGLAGDLVEG